MDKIAKNYKIGCMATYQVNQMPCGQPIYNFGMPNTVMFCDIVNLASRLEQYEDLDMTPEEIRQLIRDSEEVSDSLIKYRNEKHWFNAMSPRKWDEYLEMLSKASKYDELKKLVTDGEELADAYIKYRNRCVELEEENEALKKAISDLEVDLLNEQSKYIVKLEADTKEERDLKVKEVSVKLGYMIG